MSRTDAPPPIGRILSLRRVIYLLLMLLLLYVVVPRLNIFVLSTNELIKVNPYWLAASVTCLGVSYFFSAAEYYFLSNRKLPYTRTAIIQTAATFADRLLPAGSGAFGVSYLYIRRQGFDEYKAAAVVLANNLLGFIGHGLLFALVLLFARQEIKLSGISIPLAGWEWLALPFALGLLAGALLLFPKVRAWLQRTLTEIIKSLWAYKQQPFSVGLALLSSMAVTLSYVACLLAAALASGIHITPIEAFIVLTLSVGAGTFIPTPGGLGGAEAGMVAGLVGLGNTAHDALEAALLFRFVTFWLAIAGGAIAFAFIERKGYIRLPGRN